MKVNVVQCCFGPYLLSLNGQKQLNHLSEYLLLCSSFPSNYNKCGLKLLSFKKYTKAPKKIKSKSGPYG